MSVLFCIFLFCQVAIAGPEGNSRLVQKNAEFRLLKNIKANSGSGPQTVENRLAQSTLTRELKKYLQMDLKNGISKSVTAPKNCSGAQDTPDVDEDPQEHADDYEIQNCKIADLEPLLKEQSDQNLRLAVGVKRFKDCLSRVQGSRSKYLFATAALKRKNKLYHLYIDRERLKEPNSGEQEALDKGKITPATLFDLREPNYSSGMINALENVLGYSIDRPVDLDLVSRLRNRATRNVITEEGEEFQTGISPGWYYEITRDKVYNNDWVPEGVKALQELYEEGVLYTDAPIPGVPRSEDLDFKQSFLSLLAPWPGSVPVSSQLKQHVLAERKKKHQVLDLDKKPITESEATAVAKSKLQPVFKRYHSQISSAKSDDEKLEAIARLVRALEVYHIFPDGNQRTMVFLLLNKLLLENNFPPVILDDPFIFDGYISAKGLVEAIKKGFSNFFEEAYL